MSNVEPVCHVFGKFKLLLNGLVLCETQTKFNTWKQILVSDISRIRYDFFEIVLILLWVTSCSPSCCLIFNMVFFWWQSMLVLVRLPEHLHLISPFLSAIRSDHCFGLACLPKKRRPLLTTAYFSVMCDKQKVTNFQIHKIVYCDAIDLLIEFSYWHRLKRINRL